MDTVNINIEAFKQLKRLYNQAVKNNANEFQFQGKTLLTAYAKYLIEYLTPQFKNHE